MSALTLGFQSRAEHALGRSFVLAALVHIALAAVLFLGVRFQSHAPDTVTVDLVEAPPPPAPVVEAPKPPPLPKVEPEPPRVKPDIAVREVKPPPKKAPPKVDQDMQKRLREQLAQEQKTLDKQRQERELRELLERQQADAARAAAAARAKALNEYISRIQAKVRGNWLLPQDIRGNPEAVFLVVQLPSGDVLTARLVKSSGNPAYDTAVERAILRSSPLPLPASKELFSRELKLTFRPLDK